MSYGRRILSPVKCEAADAEGFGYCGTRALDAALRADALVSDAKDREDICEWCAVEGKVDYSALYETLSRVLAEDRRLRKDLDVPKSDFFKAIGAGLISGQVRCIAHSITPGLGRQRRPAAQQGAEDGRRRR